jgi:hypothetical protein
MRKKMQVVLQLNSIANGCMRSGPAFVKDREYGIREHES